MIIETNLEENVAVFRLWSLDQFFMKKIKYCTLSIDVMSSPREMKKVKIIYFETNCYISLTYVQK